MRLRLKISFVNLNRKATDQVFRISLCRAVNFNYDNRQCPAANLAFRDGIIKKLVNPIASQKRWARPGIVAVHAMRYFTAALIKHIYGPFILYSYKQASIYQEFKQKFSDFNFLEVSSHNRLQCPIVQSNKIQNRCSSIKTTTRPVPRVLTAVQIYIASEFPSGHCL